MNRFVDRRIWLKKSPRIMDFSDTQLNELADLENRTDQFTDHCAFGPGLWILPVLKFGF